MMRSKTMPTIVLKELKIMTQVVMKGNTLYQYVYLDEKLIASQILLEMPGMANTVQEQELIPFEKLLVATRAEGSIEIADSMFLNTCDLIIDDVYYEYFVYSPHLAEKVYIKDAADLRDFFNRYDLPMVEI
jgi:hypothetical protein